MHAGVHYLFSWREWHGTQHGQVTGGGMSGDARAGGKIIGKSLKTSN